MKDKWGSITPGEAAQVIHSNVWHFRRLYEGHWPTPDKIDSLRYAYTEMGEAVDARLRSFRPKDARNRDRKHDEAEELADCLIMLLTALGPDWNEWDYPEGSVGFRDRYNLDSLAFGVGLVLVRAAGPHWTSEIICSSAEQSIQWLAQDIIVYMFKVMRRDPNYVVKERVSRIYAKHVLPKKGSG